jgi:hypothetical protein
MEDFFKYGIWAEDFKDINIKGLSAAPPPSTKETLIHLENGKDFSILNSFIKAPEKSFLEKKNVSGDIILRNNNFSN